MKKNNTKVELKKYLSQKEKIKNTFISSCIILVVLTFFIFITYSYFIKDSGEIDVGTIQTAIANSDVEIADKQIVENSNNKKAIITIQNNSSTNTYSYNLNYQEDENYYEIYYDIPSEEYSHSKGIIKPNEEKKIYVISKSNYIINDLNLKVDSGYEYSPVKISNGYEEIKYLSLKNGDNAIVDELREKYGIYIDEIQTTTPNFYEGYPTDYNDTSQSGLYKTQDDDGDSYYFRGAVTNNYVKFADHYWQILRINGDGTIRLILAYSVFQSKYNYYYGVAKDKYLGYTYDNYNSCTNKNPCVSDYSYDGHMFTAENIGMYSTIKEELEEWYISNLHEYDDYIVLTKYCNDTSEFYMDEQYKYFSPYIRYNDMSFKPSLKCPDPKKMDGNMQTFGGVYKLKIGLASADELIMAGAGHSVEDNNYLLQNGTSAEFWSMTPAYYSHLSSDNPIPEVFKNAYDAPSPIPEDVNLSFAVRPVINLKSNTHFIYGDGSIDDPYTLE